QLGAGADVQLGEPLAQVVLDGAGAEKQPGTDLGVGEAVAGQPCDQRLLGRQFVARLGRPLAGGLAGGQQLAPGPLGESLDSHCVQQVVGGAQLCPGVDATAPAAQPLPVEQVGA